MRRRFRSSLPLGGTLILTLISVWAASGARAEDVAPPADDTLALRAELVAERFLAGDLDSLPDMMSAEMRAAFTPEDMQRVLADMIEEQGSPKEIHDAWKEDTIEGHARYRVPVDFEQGALDLRVVFDSAGDVAGFFQLPRLAPPSTRILEPGPRPELEGHWEGSIELPTLDLGVKVDLAWEDSTWSARIDIPMQGAEGLPLAVLRLAGDEIELALTGVPGDPVFKGKLEAGKLAGDFTQSGMSFPFSLGRERKPEPARPQEPKPPFPYREEELSIASAGITLAGTLTLPEGEGPFPAALLITGSGPQDRNEEIFGHKPFLVLADHLTRAGIAVLRVDDRGVGGSGGDPSSATTADLAADARAELNILKTHSAIDPRRTGVIGHSEGAIIAAMIAVEPNAAAFAVLLAGPGVRGDSVLARQMSLFLRAKGVSEEESAAVLDAQRRLMDLVVADAPLDSIRAQYARLLRAESAPGEQQVEISDEELAAAVSGPSGIASPWFRFFLAYDPRLALSRIKVPVLALDGSLDLQVDPEQNLPEIRRALAEAGNTDATVLELEGLNHLFQPAETGTVDEYAAIEQTFDAHALDIVRDWILARFGN